MKGSELPAIRERLGDLWGLGRPLRKTEFGRCLGLQGAAHQTVWRWETEDSEIALHFERVIEAMLTAGYRPAYKIQRKSSKVVASDL